jgi:hypothetical protein
MGRTLLVLWVAMLMAALAVATAVPAFAQADPPSLPGCKGIKQAVAKGADPPLKAPEDVPQGPAPPLAVPCLLV